MKKEKKEIKEKKKRKKRNKKKLFANIQINMLICRTSDA